MRRLIACVLLLAIFAQFFYNLGVIGYFYLNRKYVVENLCVNINRPTAMCYGQCFLRKSLQVTEPADKDTGIVTQMKFEMPDFLVNEFTFPVGTETINKSLYSRFSEVAVEGFTPGIFHPPLV